jgi:ectoine hydroxylase-related dioxygenase (phytanoyl-CoA dioxygenase family)
MATTLTSDVIQSFHEKGYLCVPEITTVEEVVRIRGLYDSLFKQRSGWEKGDFFDFAGSDSPDAAATLPQLLNPSRYQPMLKDTLFRSNAHAIAKQLLGPTAELVFEHAMMKPAKTGAETPWHQDEAFYPKFTNYQSITFWLPLQPVNALNGCLDFIPGSHKGPLLPHHSLNDDPRIHGLEALGADANQRVACPLLEGGATIHHYRTLHHAGPNLSDGPRRAYALGFGVRSPKFILRDDFAWNIARDTARMKRANEAIGPAQRFMNLMKSTAKPLFRR